MKFITGGTLIDGTGREPVLNAAIVVDDEGRIIDVGESVSCPAGSEIIDVSGMTIMPGLIDCHVHLFVDLKPMHELALIPPSLKVIQAVKNAKATLDAGVTAIRDTGGTPRGFKQAAQQGLIPAPRMRISVSILSQTGGHADFLLPSGIRQPLLPDGYEMEWPSGVCDGVQEVRKTVRAILRSGADFVKLCSTGGVLSPNDEPGSTQFTKEEIAVMVDEAKAQGKPCAAHAQATEGIRNAVECGVESIEHGIYLDESVVETMKARNVFLVATLVAPIWGQRLAEREPGTVLPDSLRKAKEVQEVHGDSFRLAVESGVRIAMGTDTGVGPHGSNLEELRLMVKYGMTPMSAIVAATKTASECLHMDDDIGTLEKGKFADLLVVSGNPIEDITLLENQTNLMMIMQGQYVHKNILTTR